ncbi:MAG: HEPN domain-containing protein [Nanoarchaeota archaeon]
MRQEDFHELFTNPGQISEKIRQWQKKRIIKSHPPEHSVVLGHLQKSSHNLQFVNDVRKLGYADWAITGCYYALYHAALALIVKKGFMSKSHDATLLLLIRHYYRKGITEQDINLANILYFTHQEMTFYLDARIKREKASYSSSWIFDAGLVSSMQKETIAFIDKAKQILKP